MNSKQLKEMIQGSDEWKAWRMDKIGASDAVIIMGLGYMTPLELYKQKKELAPPSFVSAAMQRGTDMEEEARSWYIAMTGIEVLPAVTLSSEYEFLHASLDGIDIFGQRALEIKCPGENKLKKLKSDPLSAEYYCQIQHQFLVNPNLEIIDLCIYQGDLKVLPDQGHIVSVERDQAFIDEMLPKLIEFNECLVNNIPPGEPKKVVEYDSIESDEWNELQAQLKECRAFRKNYQDLEKVLEEKVEALAQGRNCKGAGMTLTYTPVQGRVDYDSIPQLKGVDLNKYRKEATMRVSIKVE